MGAVHQQVNTEGSKKLNPPNQPMNKSSNRDAKNAILNVLFFPGLGSLRSGRKVTGTGQILLVLTGSGMLLVWFFDELSQYYSLMFDNVKQQSVGWIGVTGGIIFGISWLWAAATSFSLFRSASKIAPLQPPILMMDKTLLDQAFITEALLKLPQWKRDNALCSPAWSTT